ncbi:hypothetical protein PPTG_01449 [Phytophthora nicotianae INRA-310]|uniref:Uncharacterized protein n=1 Tax=Phytophthora nicotianae (strain INRA-310) TaxID=761204 RepID=W2R6Z4_PHYN3|nr:hypothetical protein PPTG_01449 [Phytophthora nicotianae INRA-310]ETN21183.1 hypothetical protein PPTG_01449 [Phytophthora nicotianae INRA-310]
MIRETDEDEEIKGVVTDNSTNPPQCNGVPSTGDVEALTLLMNELTMEARRRDEPRAKILRLKVAQR